jgi:hypothetical protein
MHGNVSAIWVVADPSLRLVELLEFLEDKAVVCEFVLALTVDTDCSNKPIITRWSLLRTINTKQCILIYIDLQWNRLILLQSLGPEIRMIERFKIDH